MIDGFSISGYRSFGPDEVKIQDLTKLNFFIGKNNCGKSNILRFLGRFSPQLGLINQTGSFGGIDPRLDFSLGSGEPTISIGIQVKKIGFTSKAFDGAYRYLEKAHPTLAERLDSVFWPQYKVGPGGRITATLDSIESVLRHRFQPHEITHIYQRFNPRDTSRNEEERYASVANSIHEESRINVDVHVIDAFRKISLDGQDKLTGAGLIRELRNLQSPGHTVYTSSREKFQKIGDFVRSVLGEPSARIEIPAETDDVYVVINDKTLPLDSLGAGIHEIVILATAVTLIDGAVVCIEEPEIHCHPELQKKFARFLLDKTNNQYLISTHSNAFLDMPEANTSRCWLDDSHHTKCELASASSDKHAILVDLGYKPSDLLQANYVIWVEGPSDRIYIKKWLNAKAPGLVEGLHYTTMFYGGRLLSHLSYDCVPSDDEIVVNDFIRLARLNRNACIVIDSDRKTSEDDLNVTKLRICAEFEKESCFVWVTEGRTIENYLTESLLNEAIEAVHPRSAKTVVWKQFSDLTRLDGKKICDKVAVAHNIADKPADFSKLDL